MCGYFLMFGCGIFPMTQRWQFFTWSSTSRFKPAQKNLCLAGDNGPHARTFSCSYSKFLSLFSYEGLVQTPHQIQQTLLTLEKCVNDLREHDQSHLCTCTRIVHLHTPHPNQYHLRLRFPSPVQGRVEC